MAKVLIVDDEPHIRESLEAGLQAKGFETLLAANGEEAMERALRESPDIILLDVMMPKLDGMSACRRLKALMEGFVPVILTTAMGTQEDKRTGTEHGADDYLVKPFSIEAVATRIDALLRIKSGHDRLKGEAAMDFVTGTHNRRYLQSQLRGDCVRAERSQMPLSCFFVDLDRFKAVNDLFGHTFGDRVLKETANVLKKFVGTNATLARWGGDEFVMVFPGVFGEAARSLAERIRAEIQTHDFNADENRLSVTCSIGVASFPDDGLIDSDDLIKAVDGLLHASKNAGRNAVTVRTAS